MAGAMQCVYLIVLPVFGVFVCTGQAEDTCQVRTLRPEVFVPLGEWVLLNCTFNCPGNTIWKSRLLKNNSQWGPNWASIKVLVDDWEKSELYCIQVLDDESTKQSISVVRAYALPSNVTIDLDEEIEEGKSHHVNCTVYDVAPVENLQIQLLRADTVIQNSTFKEDKQLGKQTVKAAYEVRASRKDNLQSFSCLALVNLATGSFTTVSSSVTVRTYGQPDLPVVTITPKSIIQEGDSFSIKCLSDGSPSPKYSWKVPTGAEVTYSQNNSTVSITRAGQIHNGTYICEAWNEHGGVKVSQNVEVIPLTKGLPRRHIGDIISVVLTFIIHPFILWKTRIRSLPPT